MSYIYSEWHEDTELTFEQAQEMLNEHNAGKITIPPGMLKLMSPDEEDE